MFRSLDSFKAAIAPAVVEQYWFRIENLVEKQLPPAVSIEVVAQLFSLTPKYVEDLSSFPERYYRAFEVRTGSKLRKIRVPHKQLKAIQRWLGFHLGSAVALESEVFGFIKHASSLKAAKHHCHAKWVYSTDITDFFGTTSKRQVIGALQDMGYLPHEADLIASLCCVDGALPQGSPSSPSISNLVFCQLDRQLKGLAAATESRYSRYADDITFSGVGDPPDDLPRRVTARIEDAGWSIAKEKEHMAKFPDRLEVLGLLVDGSELRLRPEHQQRVEQMAELLRINAVPVKDIARVRGHVAYAQAIAKINGSATKIDRFASVEETQVIKDDMTTKDQTRSSDPITALTRVRSHKGAMNAISD